ncbi:baseplate J/gp47 family protein [Endozoicomonas sp. SM1973]|uniref:Baseplate J/gp47 family protein n=1 Tax=Spartinivicinus marinus TaxID=2994442 RepID=A0A853IGN7_9GAMM|nr:baseplate J/gp47 family protein [Spartinivicinus marinus]MCX4029615.1 baseplate J/gp47 family protein [Spartinivicinus marinus]NYZ69174.1 baseplate J/gp47 family protein [Spartinivicinus marinus]
MPNQSPFKVAIERSGLRQTDRIKTALNPTTVAIEERSMKDWLGFLNAFASQLPFINQQNNQTGHWEKLFSLPAEKLLNYFNDPEAFLSGADVDHNTQEAMASFQNPALVLLLTFLHLLKQPKQDLAAITQRHFDFYYRQVLQLSKQPGVADKVHVALGLNDGYQEQALTKGTLFLAGQKTDGSPLHYQLIDNTNVNQGKLMAVRTLRRYDKYFTLNEMRRHYQQGFVKVLHWVLGQYYQGDEFPPYPTGKFWDESVSVDFLLELHEQYAPTRDGKPISSEATHYIHDQLYFSQVADFFACMELLRRQRAQQDLPSEEEWAAGCALLEQVWLNKQQQQTMVGYHRERESGGLMAMFRRALGQPNPGDPLPALPGNRDSFDSLYLDLLQLPATHDQYLLASRYVEQALGMGVDDFIAIMVVKQADDFGTATPDQWQSVYAKLEQAAQTSSQQAYTPAGFTDTRCLHPQRIETPEGGGQLSAFASVGLSQDHPSLTAITDPSAFYAPGVAISSPLLQLESGVRTIELTLACKSKGFPLEDLQQLNQRNQLPFDIRLSGSDEWQGLVARGGNANARVEVDQLGDELIKRYGSDRLWLLVTLLGARVKKYDVLILDTGHQHYWGIWQVMATADVASTQSTAAKGVTQRQQAVKLSFQGRLDNQWYSGRLRIDNNAQPPASLRLVDVASNDLTRATLDVAKQEVVFSQGADQRFEDSDVGEFIVWDGGQLLVIESVVNGKAQVVTIGDAPLLEERFWFQQYPGLTWQQSQSLAGNYSISGAEFAPDDSKTEAFTAADEDRLLQFNDGLVLLINRLVPNDEHDPSNNGAGNNSGNSNSNIAEQRFATARTKTLTHRLPAPLAFGEPVPLEVEKKAAYPGLRFTLVLPKSAQAVMAPGPDFKMAGLAKGLPVLEVRLKNEVASNMAGPQVDIPYEFFRQVRLHKASLKVTVADIQHLRVKTDIALMDPASPFEPFGFTPVVGANCYFGCNELSQKKLDSLSLTFHWAGLPASFEQHYQTYTEAGLLGLPTKVDEDSFTVQLSQYSNNSWLAIDSPKPLFKADRQGVKQVAYLQGFNRTGYYHLLDGESSELVDPLDFRRYFRLQLQGPDFFHHYYPSLTSMVAAKNSQQGTTTVVYPPYTPKLSRFSVGYTASAVIDPYADHYANDVHQLVHLYPFGSLDIVHTLNQEARLLGSYLLPKLVDEGSLYLGLSGTKPGQTLNLWLQTVNGTGRFGLGAPTLRIACRTLQGWQALSAEEFLGDATQGLTQPGLIRLRLPLAASAEGPLMDEGLYWLKISVTDRADAASWLEAIYAQGALLVAVDKPESINPVLGADSITNLVSPLGSIAEIKQPYPSFGGRSPEVDEAFATRVSERLGHRQRAAMLRDYEQLVLQQFPDIIYAKCLGYDEQRANNQLDENNQGEVRVMVLPDVTHLAPDVPLEPQVSQVTLNSIQQYLQPLTSPFARLQVVNPTFEQVLFRLAVRFYDMSSAGYYRRQLNRAIQQFLSPWGYQLAERPTVGGIIYRSALIYYLEGLEYVDYVAVVDVYLQNPGASDHELNYGYIPDGIVRVRVPDGVISSAPNHIIDTITTAVFQAEDFQGIGHMIVGLDFQVIAPEY